MACERRQARSSDARKRNIQEQRAQTWYPISAFNALTCTNPPEMLRAVPCQGKIHVARARWLAVVGLENESISALVDTSLDRRSPSGHRCFQITLGAPVRRRCANFRQLRAIGFLEPSLHELLQCDRISLKDPTAPLGTDRCNTRVLQRLDLCALSKRPLPLTLAVEAPQVQVAAWRRGRSPQLIGLADAYRLHIGCSVQDAYVSQHQRERLLHGPGTSR